MSRNIVFFPPQYSHEQDFVNFFLSEKVKWLFKNFIVAVPTTNDENEKSYFYCQKSGGTMTLLRAHRAIFNFQNILAIKIAQNLK